VPPIVLSFSKPSSRQALSFRPFVNASAQISIDRKYSFFRAQIQTGLRPCIRFSSITLPHTSRRGEPDYLQSPWSPSKTISDDMYLNCATLAASLLLGSATAIPLASRTTGNSAVSILQAIMPSSTACPPSLAPDCSTATQAAPLLIDAMQAYGVKTAGEIAGILALVGFESNQMQYRHNVAGGPDGKGNPGQGTSNMMMPNFVLEFAQSFPELKGQLSSILNGASSADSLSDDQKNQVLALATDDNHNFKSGPWFYSTQCSAEVKTSLKTGTTSGFNDYMSCLGVQVTSARTAVWQSAQQAFGLSG
jgi:hypothetical protein